MNLKNYLNIFNSFMIIRNEKKLPLIYINSVVITIIYILGGFFMDERMITKKPIGVHKIQVISRNQTNITGVNDVLSFDAGEILLETEQGILMIRGQELHVNRLTLEKGEVDVEGRIDSLTYSDTSGYGKTAESFVSRLFK